MKTTEDRKEFKAKQFRHGKEFRLINPALQNSNAIFSEFRSGGHRGEFFIDHGTGIVIGVTCIIGNRVRIYQGVTLGAKSFQLDEDGNAVRGIDRHPIVEDDVTIYSGATILGRVTIGRGSVIGGNVWLVHTCRRGAGSPRPRAARMSSNGERGSDFPANR